MKYCGINVFCKVGLRKWVHHFGTTEFSFFHSLRKEIFLGLLWDILSALLRSLFLVYFVVRCCDLCGVLMYLFILFQLCRIYNGEKKENQSHSFILRVFISALPQAIEKRFGFSYFYCHFSSLELNCFEIHLFQEVVHRWFGPREISRNVYSPLNIMCKIFIHQTRGSIRNQIAFDVIHPYVPSFTSRKMTSKLIRSLHQSLITLISAALCKFPLLLIDAMIWCDTAEKSRKLLFCLDNCLEDGLCADFMIHCSRYSLSCLEMSLNEAINHLQIAVRLCAQISNS